MAVDQEQISTLFRKLERELTKLSSKPQPRAVHQFRTSTRRVEAVLEELLPEPDRNLRKLIKQLGKLRKRAGQVRDIDVQITNLRNLKVSEEPRRKAEVLRSLADIRSRREQKLLDSLDKGKEREIRKRLKRAAASLTLPDTDLVVLAKRKFEELVREHSTVNEEVLHQYRIKGKRIRYIAEVAGDSPEAKRIVQELKRMQDAIGEWHDWLTLSERADKSWTDGRPSALLSALKNITRAKYRDACRMVAATKSALLEQEAIKSTVTSRRKPVASSSAAAAAVAVA